MHIVNIHDAKTHLSRLLEEVAEGGQVIIARAGQPIAQLSAYRGARRKVAPPGSMQGQIWIAEDFDASLDALFNALS